MERVLRQLSDSFIREKGRLMVPLSRFSLNRPTASLKKGSSPFRGENFRCYSTCFSSNRARQRRDLYSVARSLEDDRTSCRFSRFVTSINIYTHIFSSLSSLLVSVGRRARSTIETDDVGETGKYTFGRAQTGPIHPNVNIGQTTEPPPYF